MLGTLVSLLEGIYETYGTTLEDDQKKLWEAETSNFSHKKLISIKYRKNQKEVLVNGIHSGKTLLKYVKESK
jgi:hypothetical protein